MKSLLLTLLIVLALPGQKLEGSKTERVLKAWVAMQNAGTDAAVRHFIDGYYGPTLLEEMRNYEAHVKFYKQIINEFGPVQDIIYHTEETSDNKLKVQLLNPDFALELRYEGLNCTESGSFTGFSIAPLWLNQKTHTFH